MTQSCNQCGSNAHSICVPADSGVLSSRPVRTASVPPIPNTPPLPNTPPIPADQHRLLRNYQPPGITPLDVTIRFCRSYFDWAAHNESIEFPANPNRYFGLEIVKDEITIGRSDVVRSIFPDVDINSFTGDLGVSVNHVLLRVSANGDLLITDLGSRNGTFVGSFQNKPLRPGLSVPVSHGQSVYIGAWTELIFSQ